MKVEPRSALVLSSSFDIFIFKRQVLISILSSPKDLVPEKRNSMECPGKTIPPTLGSPQWLSSFSRHMSLCSSYLRCKWCLLTQLDKKENLGGCIRERCREEKVGEEKGAGVSFLGCLGLPYLSWTCHSRRVPTEMMSLKRRGSASWSRGRGAWEWSEPEDVFTEL